MSVNFLNLRDYFRDDEQRSVVQKVVQSRLADDQDREECRYLMRFWWQLNMTYREVTLGELERFVSPVKLGIIMDLLHSLEQGHKDIDAWIDKYTAEIAVVEDRGFQNYEVQNLG
jgi:hypothetical protein